MLMTSSYILQTVFYFYLIILLVNNIIYRDKNQVKYNIYRFYVKTFLTGKPI